MTLTIKANNEYAAIKTLYQKAYGTYFPANQIYVKENGAYVQQGYAWNNGPKIDVVIPIGSSTTLYAFDSGGSYNINQTQFVRQRFCEMGIDLPALTNAFSMDGGTTTSGKATIDTALASINANGISAKGIIIGFPINLGNNDIIGYRWEDTQWAADPAYPSDATLNVVNAWPVADQARKDAIIANLRYIVAAIYAAGHQPMLGTINPRAGNAVFKEFKKWNDNIWKPLILELCPQWINTDGEPVYDMEKLYWDNRNIYTISEWYVPDGTHPSLIAIDAIQRYLAQSWGRYAQAPRLINPYRSIIIAFNGSYIYQRGGINQCVVYTTGAVQTPSQTGLYDRRGNFRSTASFTISGYQSLSSVSKGNLGVYTIGLESDVIQKSVAFNYNNTPVNVDISMGVDYAGKVGSVKVTLASGNWGSTYTVQGTVIALRGMDPGPQIASFPITLDNTGSVRIVCTRGFGNYYAGISGAELIID